MKNSLILIISLILVMFLFAKLVSASTHDSYYDEQNLFMQNTSRAMETSINLAECKKCEVCGRECEKQGDIYLGKKDYTTALEAYKKALKVYSDQIDLNPSNRCVKYGIERTKEKINSLSP